MRMIGSFSRAVLAATASLALAACDTQPALTKPENIESTTAAPDPVDPAPTPATAPTPPPSETATGAAGAAGADASKIDFGALQERRDPERLLRYYANVLRSGRWNDAARAWSSDAMVTPEMLANVYGKGELPVLAIGKGDTEGAAGSLYYEAPITVSFPDDRPSLRGTITLRRVNDVPGASQEQLTWRIEHSSLMPSR